MADEPEHGGEGEQRCLSRNLNGVRCERQLDHADFHSATAEGVGYAWSDPRTAPTAMAGKGRASPRGGSKPN